MPAGASNLVYKLNLFELVLGLQLFERNLQLIYVTDTSIKEVKEVIDKEFEFVFLLFKGKKITLLCSLDIKIQTQIHDKKPQAKELKINPSKNVSFNDSVFTEEEQKHMSVSFGNEGQFFNIELKKDEAR